MTIEDRYVIDLADIRALRIDCGACGGSVSRKAGSGEALIRCPLCSTEWMLFESEQHKAMNRLHLALGAMLVQSKEAGYRVCLEVDRPKP